MPKINKCIICNNKNLIYYDAKFDSFLIDRMFKGKRQDTSLAYCSNCNSYFSSYRPSSNEINNLYYGYRNKKYKKQLHQYNSDAINEFVERIENINFINFRKNFYYNLFYNNLNVKKINNILDFGGFDGRVIPDGITNNKYVYDISNTKSLEDIKRIKTKRELRNIKWDLIMCCHVLEHCVYPMRLIDTLLSLLSDRGEIYVELPIVHDARKNKYITEHINMFSMNTFKYIINKKNLKVNFIKESIDHNISATEGTLHFLFSKNI